MAQIDHEPSRTLHRRKTEKKIFRRRIEGERNQATRVFSAVFFVDSSHTPSTHIKANSTVNTIN